MRRPSEPNAASNLSAPTFVIADLHEHRGELFTLNVAYLSWVFAGVERHFGVRPAEIVGMDAVQYVDSVLDKICDHTPPKGVFYLVRHDGQFIGMGGLRALTAELVEINRVYVRPSFRGSRLGQAILARLMNDAARFAYQRVCLETAPFMTTAHRIYKAAGFVDRQPIRRLRCQKSSIRIGASWSARFRPAGETRSVPRTISWIYLLTRSIRANTSADSAGDATDRDVASRSLKCDGKRSASRSSDLSAGANVWCSSR